MVSLRFIGLSMVVLLATSAMAITVDSTDDDLDLGPNGNCTLREAVLAANQDVAVDACEAGSGADTIDLPAGNYSLAIEGREEDAGATGDLDVTADLMIRGAGAALTTVDAQALDGVIEVHGLISVTISDLGLAFGERREPHACGGALLSHEATVTLERVTVHDNDAFAVWLDPEDFSQADAFGGGLCNEAGEMRVLASTLHSNQSTGASSSLAGSGWGGAIYSGGMLTVEDSTISDNRTVGGLGFLGGGIAGSFGGGIHDAGTAVVERSLIRANEAMYGAGIASRGTTMVQNATIAENAAAIWVPQSGCCSFYKGSGGALRVLAGGAVTLLDVTVKDNSSEVTSGGGIEGIDVQAGATVQIARSILADACGGDSDIDSLGFNLAADGSCGLDEATDLPDTDPGLGELADNGGPTLSYLPEASSAVVDSSDDASCPTVDQRGFARPEDGDGNGTPRCDRGAIEAPVGRPGCGGTVTRASGPGGASLPLALLLAWGTRRRSRQR